MNIHEYQAKELFAKYGIAIPKGYAAHSKNEIQQALEQLPEGRIVVKSQIHAGGRGKGVFTDGFQGGVKVTPSKKDAVEVADRMLGNVLVTKQTGPLGRKVNTLYFTETNSIKKEYYMAILLDRKVAQPVIIASTEGGMDIEKVAAETPEKIVRVHVDPLFGLRDYEAREVAFALGFREDLLKQCVKLIRSLYKLYWDLDASLVEINPLVVTEDSQLVALDAKINFDDNALYRHPDVLALRDLNEEDPKEVAASNFSLNYIALEGNIACLVNGAGLAMGTMDIIQHYGGKPANFLDVGGGANEEQVTEAFKIILTDPSVKGILVNIFGGIMKCDIIARGIIAAAQKLHLSLPLVVRLEGTNVKEGKELLKNSGLALIPADSLGDAAQKIVAAVKKA